jgi:predicted nucleic acid-binding protein
MNLRKRDSDYIWVTDVAILTVLYDACVLYPAPLRDLLMHLALTGLFRAKWSADIHEEWIENLLAARPDLSRVQLQRTRRLMDTHVLDSLVEGYAPLIESLSLPDPNDRHVLAAAITGEANIIVTFNLNDFPEASLQPHDIEAWHPDVFITYLIDLEPAIVCAAIKQHRCSLRNPPKSAEEYLVIIGRQGLTRTVARLRAFILDI